MSPNSSERPAVVLDSNYVKEIRLATSKGGQFSRHLAAAAVYAGNRAVNEGRLFEFMDLCERRDLCDPVMKRNYTSAINAIYGIALGVEKISKSGIISYEVNAKQCTPEALAEADKSTYEGRRNVLKHLDAVRVRIIRDKVDKSLEDLQSAAVAAYGAFKAKGGAFLDFLKEVEPEIFKALQEADAKAAKSAKAKAARSAKAKAAKEADAAA